MPQWEQQIINADEDMALVHVHWRGRVFPIEPPFQLFKGCAYLATIGDRGADAPPIVQVRVIDGHHQHAARAAAMN